MTTVYGNQIEPGGMELDDDRDTVTCPSCGCPDAILHTWEACEGGSINMYHRLNCHACGHSEGDS